MVSINDLYNYLFSGGVFTLSHSPYLLLGLLFFARRIYHFVMTFVMVAALLWFAQAHAATAAMGTANTSGKSFAAGQNSAVVNGAAAATNTANIPQYPSGPISQDSLYSGGESNLDNQAATTATTDPTSQYIQNSQNTRPYYNIDKSTDPLFYNYGTITNDANTLTQTYSGCQSLPVGKTTTTTTGTCDVYGTDPLITDSCTKVDTVTCQANAGTAAYFSPSDFVLAPAGSEPYVYGLQDFAWGHKSNYTSGNCSTDRWRTVTFTINNMSDINQFYIEDIWYDDWIKVSINGTKVFQGDYDGPDFYSIAAGWFPELVYDAANNGMAYCDQGHPREYAAQINLKPYLHTGTNTLRWDWYIDGAGNDYVQIHATKFVPCNGTDSITESCSDGYNPSGQTPVSSTCTDSGYHNIDGLQVYRSCWQWADTYQHYGPVQYTESPACQTLRNQGCYQTASSCSTTDPLGFCDDNVLTFTCNDTHPTTSVDLCGNTLDCPNGDCASDYKTQVDATPDFKKAATDLSVAGSIAKNFDFSNLSVWKGTAMSCTIDILNYSNCCATSGWGISLGLSSCTTNEKTLGLAREAKKTHYIGSYTTGGVLTKKTHQVYCVYPSMLARIVMEQANLQLGIGYGTPTAPICTGLTLTQLEALNFDSLDLSEFYATVTNQANNAILGDPSTVITQLQQQVANMSIP